MELEIFGEGLEEEEIIALKENVAFFLATPRGSLPQRRDYGLDASIYDEPFESFRMKATVDIVAGLRKHLGVNPSRIQITQLENGRAKLRLEFGDKF